MATKTLVITHPSTAATAPAGGITTPHIDAILEARRLRDRLRADLKAAEERLDALEGECIARYEANEPLLSRKFRLSVEEKLNPPQVSWLKEFTRVAGELEVDRIKSAAPRSVRKVLIIN